LPAGGTGAITAAAGAEAGIAGGEAEETGLAGLGAGGDIGLAGGAAATALAGGATATGLAGGAADTGLAGGAAATALAGGAAATALAGGAAATALAGGAADTGLAGGAAADDVFCPGSAFIAASGLGNPAGMAKLGGAARPTWVLPSVGLSSDFPVMGQVRVSGRCCFWQ
jgi:hypothetical protein